MKHYKKTIVKEPTVDSIAHLKALLKKFNPSPGQEKAAKSEYIFGYMSKQDYYDYQYYYDYWDDLMPAGPVKFNVGDLYECPSKTKYIPSKYVKPKT